MFSRIPWSRASQRLLGVAALAAWTAAAVYAQGAAGPGVPTPAPPERRAVTRSPIPAIAIPRQSKPGPTFDVEPGA